MSNSALGLANTVFDSGSGLRAWLEAESGLEERESAEVSLRLAEFVALRDSLRELLEASIGGGPLPAAAVDRVNEASARVPRVLRLESDGPSEAPFPASATPLILARIAWSAIELVGGHDRTRLRRCGSCGRYFVSTRPDRVWCSDACGNRARVARHHARRRAPA